MGRLKWSGSVFSIGLCIGVLRGVKGVYSVVESTVQNNWFNGSQNKAKQTF